MRVKEGAVSVNLLMGNMFNHVFFVAKLRETHVPVCSNVRPSLRAATLSGISSEDWIYTGALDAQIRFAAYIQCFYECLLTSTLNSHLISALAPQE